MSSTHRYTRLLDNDTVDLMKIEYERRASFWSYAILYSGVICCGLLTCLNAYLAKSVLESASYDGQSYIRIPDSFPLPRPNQFIGLEHIDWKHLDFNEPEPFINSVLAMSQVNRLGPNYVYPDDTRRWLSKFGTVNPDDKQFLVNESTNTVAQFRVLDFGMERCELIVNVSSPAILMAESSPRIPFNRTFRSSRPDPVPITVYRVSSENILDVQILSWNSKPTRLEHLGVLHVLEGSITRLPMFECPQDSLQTFEFACDIQEGSNACSVEWWQDTRDTLGVFLRQYWSF